MTLYKDLEFGVRVIYLANHGEAAGDVGAPAYDGGAAAWDGGAAAWNVGTAAWDGGGHQPGLVGPELGQGTG